MKRINFYRIAFLVVAMAFSSLSYSQEEESTGSESKFNVGVDLQSRYVWRGLNLGGASPSIQPSVSFATDKLKIGAWGAYSINGEHPGQEADLYVTYSPSDMFSVTVTDYFFPVDALGDNAYFDYDNDITGHVLEGTLSFNGTETLPISLLVAVNFYGADKNIDGDVNYSTYVELGYSKSFADSKLGLFAGAVLNESAYYGTTGAGLINLGMKYSKEIAISDAFSLPVNGALIFNPDAGNIFITFGVSF